MKNKKRILTLIAAISIQLCLGVSYIWSIFQTGIANTLFAGNNAYASLTYSLLLAFMPIGSVIGGKLTEKIKLKNVVMIGGFTFSVGFFIASFSTPQFPYLLWLSYGLLGGLGMGLSYSTTISCAQKWFPESKGFVTGLIVASLGIGGVIFTPIVELMITAFGGEGVGELVTLRVISYIFIFITTIGSLFLAMPEELPTLEDANGSSKDLTPSQMLKKPAFYLMTGAMMLASMCGLMMIGFAKPIAAGRGMAEVATIGVLLISIFNALGRLFWGIVSDKTGRINTLMILMIGSAGLALCVNFAQGYWIFVLIGCIGFFYGGLLSTFPPLAAELFGTKHVATNYGMVLIGFGFAAIASSYIAGYFIDIAGVDIDKMFPAFAVASASAIAAIGLMFLLKKVIKKEKTKTENLPQPE